MINRIYSRSDNIDLHVLCCADVKERKKYGSLLTAGTAVDFNDCARHDRITFICYAQIEWQSNHHPARFSQRFLSIPFLESRLKLQSSNHTDHSKQLQFQVSTLH